MARGTSVYHGGAWQLVSAPHVEDGSVTGIDPTDIFVFRGGEWRWVFPFSPANTSYFLSPFGPLAALGKAAPSNPTVSYPVPFAVTQIVGIQSLGKSAPAAAGGIVPGFPSFIPVNPLTFNGGTYQGVANGTGVQNVTMLTVSPDGTWAITSTSNGVLATGNWGLPTTASIGDNYSVRFTQNSFSGTPRASSSGTTAWLNLGTARSCYCFVAGNSIQSGAANFKVEIRDVDNVVVAQGTISLRAFHNVVPDAVLAFDGQTYQDQQNSTGLTSVMRVTLFPDGTWQIAEPDLIAASGSWANPAPGTLPNIGDAYWCAFTALSESLSGSGGRSANTGWLPLSSAQLCQVYATAGIAGTAQAQFQVRIASDPSGINIVSDSIVLLTAEYIGFGTITAPNGSVVRVVAFPAQASSGIRLLPDGDVQPFVAAIMTGVVDWCVPNDAGVGAAHWVRATLLSGNVLSSGTMNTWLPLSSVQVWSNVTNGFRSSVVRFEIATDAAGSNIISTGTVTIEAESAS